MYYLIKHTLEEVNESEPLKGKNQYVSVLTSAEWAEKSEQFDMGIEMDINLSAISSTKAEVNYDSLTGTFSIPDRNSISGPQATFAFALDEKGIVFIDDTDTVNSLINDITKIKRWKKPGLERFLYDFLEQIVYHDQEILSRYDQELDRIEAEILGQNEENPSQRISSIRSDLRDMRIHYEQLLDMTQELEENENNFFKTENIRYFRLITQRISALRDITTSLRDYTTQVRDLYQSQLDVKQNRIMALLTIITSIFMPLTLIAGWYGMNFVYMPELQYRYAYPILTVISVLIVVISLIFFKKKKWL